MHRSGTSAVAGSLEILGGHVPQRRVPAEEGNPKGHFEPVDVVEQNNALLAKLGRRWSDFSPVTLPQPEESQHDVATLARILEEAYPEDGLAVVKDPRLSAAFPLWLAAAERLGSTVTCLIPIRAPAASAMSLKRRDGMPLSHGIALWLRAMFDSELHTRGLARAFLDPDALIVDPVAELDRISMRLGQPWPIAPGDCRDALVGFLDKSLLHGSQSVDDPLLRFATQVLDCFQQMQAGSSGDRLQQELDRLRAQFDMFSASLEDWMSHAEALAEGTAIDPDSELAVLAAKREQRFAELESEVARVSKQFEMIEAERDRAVRVIEEIRKDRDHNLQQAEAALRERDIALSVIADLQKDLDQSRKRK